ncbi:MFS transporter [Streptomyces stelliscabiei]|uniref:EmrB/QacA subfamily drug resistance transporter n=2 Tax=Streptomyces stelliscabiei TaxID=146820 RepID=A0A8I0P2H7_9ACTN|nr:MFS transporter [Streptomyces stelliscabiei]KND44245.1 MFS transporter [Streptomyces stelliscabiei]MBE1598436.1 EmrB/QacA subfamily drug resistance transporter [Streptomyces stelliscabiei]MDX2518745.1 MFS transporter [Streptomyces stelliscabiei]
MSTLTASATRGHPQRWLILGVICLAQLTVLLDNTVLNVAIPSLTEELDAATSDIQWMINAYSLVQSGLLLTAGSAADRYGRKRMLITGLVLFGIGSLVAGLAQSTGQLVAARAGMGVGGALLITTTLAVAMQIFAPEEQPRAIGIWAAVNALGFAAGPLLGGFVLAHFWWGAIFLINLPVAALGVVAVIALVPESKNPQGDRPDLVGAVLSTIGTAALVYAIISGPEHGWTSGLVLATAVVAVLVLTAFAYWESRVPSPMLDLSFFRDRRFTGAVAGAVLITFGMGGALFLLTQHLQFVLGYDAWEAGLRTAPLALVVVVLNFSGLSAKWTARLGTPVSIALGMVLMSGGLVSIATMASGGYAGTLLGLVLIGVGCAVANPAMAHAIMSAIPPARAGVGAGINGTLAEFGTGLGVAVLGAVLNSRFAALIPVSAVSLPAALGAADTAAERDRVLSAYSSGLETSLLVGAVAVLLGGLVAAGLLRRAEKEDAELVGAT